MNDSNETGAYQPDDADAPTAEDVGRAEAPLRIARYRVERVLGRGGFGVVYLAHDEQLHRPVAVKVPHRHRLLTPADAAAYWAEARAAANLDHPNIVPVHDVGSTADCPCFIVSKFIEGRTLAQRIQEGRLAFAEAAGLVATVAEALQHAHARGLVHRDIKPGNVLLDRGGKPYLTDFGLALREQDVGTGPRYAGSPAYMSPEQARGEGHRVDGRSDLFSLGVIFYELLTGRRPFTAESRNELREQIIRLDVRPPRQLDDAIPRELERICLRALCKRASERYAAAQDLADDLRQFLGRLPRPADAAAEDRPTETDVREAPVSDSRGTPVVPRGLRAFDAADADFFLELLPGPRDRHGLPEAVRFWKDRIEQTDPEETFAVGLLYGPSGCGKSSLVKAGLLPRLPPRVHILYLEATADLEAQLLHRLGKNYPEIKNQPGLPRALAALRRGEAGPPGGKVLIVLDQFEQWLHAHRQGADSDLVRALRQCDGGRLQCLALVRDDFWTMATRFLRDLEVRLVEGHNAAAVDLFTPQHARKVLTAFGQAYGTLPDHHRDLSPAQAAFLDQAVAELTEDGWVIPVRLALFAEMVKRRPWTGAVLRELGGALGVGVRFLDESFTAATAPPEHRAHQQAVRAVLAALLPGPGTDIRGAMRSRADLLEASGYCEAPAEFEGLMRVLIGKTRLLTPMATDHPGADPDPKAGPDGAAGEQYYQLTHDYLVPSIREWLARKQRETLRGRAELRLAERGGLWRAKPERRQLPSLTEWLSIRLLTAPRTWTDSQRQMMRAATRKHLLGAAKVAAAVVLLGCLAFFVRGQLAEERAAARADAVVRRLLDANIAQAPAILAELDGYRRWADPLLDRVLTDPAAPGGHRLRARLALLPADPGHVSDLRERLLEADADEFPVIRDALAPYRAGLVGGLWETLESPGGGARRRFRAAAALAAYDPDGPRWPAAAPWVAEQLVAQPSLVLPRWADALRPARERLVPALLALVRDRSAGPAGPAVAAEIVGDYAADRPAVLAEALAQAPPDSFAILFARLQAHPGRAVPALAAAFDATPPEDGPRATDRAGQRANLALALLRLGDGDHLWPLLRASPDPRARSYAIDRFAKVGCSPALLLDRLGTEPDDTARAALWLGLGGYEDHALPAARRRELTPRLLDVYRRDGSAAVHAAVYWLMGRWGVPDAARRAPPGDGRPPDSRWYVNSAGQTLIRVAGPVTYLMGAAPDEPGTKDIERRHRAEIPYSYDIGMTEVTVGEFREFLEQCPNPAYQPNHPDWDRRAADLPVTKVTWYAAAAYCNWLSEREGLPPEQWCYEATAKQKYEKGMRILPGCDRRLGYRLPTEAEWEYACRGGAATTRCYGDADDLLPRYAWCSANSADDVAPVARLLPNALGLFDVHGNASEWCLGAVRPYDERPGAEFEGETVDISDFRAVRGGSFSTYPKMIRSAKRFGDRPTLADAGGFRIARTRP